MSEPRRRSARFVLIVVALMALPLLLAVTIGLVRGPDERPAEQATASEDASINLSSAITFGITGVAVAGCVAAPFVVRAVRNRRAEPTPVRTTR